MICPSCQKDAPALVRGNGVFCTACGAPRSLATMPDAVNVAGQPAKVGGHVASALGLVALTVGLSVAAILGGLFQLLFHTGLPVAIVIVVVTLFVALPLFLGGRQLRKVGTARSLVVQEQAVTALAAQRRGILSTAEVAAALSIPEPEADALLTAMAKRPDSRVSLELSDDGALAFHFHDFIALPRIRVVEPRVGEGRAPRVGRVIEGELLEDEPPVAPPPARYVVPR
jgi:hypothetical protein